MLKDLVQLIAEALVDQPEQVQVTEIEGEQTSVIELKVAKDDLGKVIGKQGRTARAIRTILSAASTKVDVALEPASRQRLRKPASTQVSWLSSSWPLRKSEEKSQGARDDKQQKRLADVDP